MRVRVSEAAAARRRQAALALAAAVAFAVGLVAGALHVTPSERAARRFADAWARRDYGAMYRLLDHGSKKRWTPARFAAEYERARSLATVVSLRRAGDVDERRGEAIVPMEVRTRSFGTLRLPLALLVRDGSVRWSPELTFPGVRRGERLSRALRLPRRAKLLARDGKVLAEGPAESRSAPLGPAASAVAGSLGPAATEAERDYLVERGFPPSAPLGRSGLERVFDARLRGTPGGLLLAGDRVLASSRPRPAPALRTTIDTRVQAAAVAALAGRLGGVAALDPRTGEVRALAGIAFSAPQPPGSTFKIVTATAALERRLVRLDSTFPVEAKAVIDGVELENANGEYCGGTLIASFAHSCNSVFAPLGVRVGARALVRAAERYGFNRDPGIPGARPSTIPPPDEMSTPLAVASSAIGQFRLLATPLEMAQVAQAVAAEGVLHPATLLPVRGRPPSRRVTSRRVARELERMMVAVVAYGTGTAASLGPKVQVAGKTGTAELERTVPPDGEQPARDEEQEPPGSKTDAWFTAYAPTVRPRIAVAVMLVRAGAGGETAAPAARTVLAAALER